MSEDSSAAAVAASGISSEVAPLQPTGMEAKITALKNEQRARRAQYTLLRSPLRTLYEFALVLLDYVHSAVKFLLGHHKVLYSLALSAVLILLAVSIEGYHSAAVQTVSHALYFAGYWVVLGVLSSVGLGTGLHTFVLYTGPFIAKVTMAATECGTLAFATEGEDAFECPEDGTAVMPVTFLGIFMKVQMAVFLWGAGTAIGELPPYFVARTAALTGQRMAEFDEIDQAPDLAHAQTLMDRAKALLFMALQRWGFVAIMLFGSDGRVVQYFSEAKLEGPTATVAKPPVGDGGAAGAVFGVLILFCFLLCGLWKCCARAHDHHSAK